MWSNQVRPKKICESLSKKYQTPKNIYKCMKNMYYVIVMACVRKMTENSSQGRQTGAKGLGLSSENWARNVHLNVYIKNFKQMCLNYDIPTLTNLSDYLTTLSSFLIKGVLLNLIQGFRDNINHLGLQKFGKKV